MDNELALALAKFQATHVLGIDESAAVDPELLERLVEELRIPERRVGGHAFA